MSTKQNKEGAASAAPDLSVALGLVNDVSDDLARLRNGIAALETLAHAAGGEGLALSAGDVAGAAYWIAGHLGSDLEKAQQQAERAGAMLRLKK